MNTILKWTIGLLILAACFWYWYVSEHGNHEPSSEQVEGYNNCVAKGGKEVDCYRWYYGD